MAVAPDKIRFGRWQLDLQRRALCDGGVPVPLKGRAFDLLALLVAHPGQRVSNEDIFANVWPGITVGENNLRVQIRNLRVALGEEDLDGGGLIVTVQRGYKFAGEVEEGVIDHAPATLTGGGEQLPVNAPISPVPNPVATRRSQRGMVTSALAAGLILVLGTGASLIWRQTPTAPRLSIAVLPFRNLSPDHAQDYLADALTDDLTTDLAHIPGSTVIARESADTYRERSVIAQTIGHALRVRYLIDGSLHVEDGQYSVNIQLVDARSGQHLWASRLPPVQGLLSEVRDTIVHRLATALHFQLDQIESARSVDDRPDDPDSLDLFLRARAILDWDSSLAGLTRAQKLLEQAIAQQPHFGDALAELGAMLLTKVHDMEDPTDDQDNAEARIMIKRALEIAPRNARALAAQGSALALDGKWLDASYSASTALAIEPSSVEALSVLSTCAQAQGKLDEGADHIQMILRLTPEAPLNKSRFLTLGIIRLVEGRVNEGLELLRRAVAGDQPDAAPETMGRVEVTRLMLIAGYELSGLHTEAATMYKEYKTTWPNRTVWRVKSLFNKSYSQMSGFTRLMKALGEAGMPLYADEHEKPASDLKSCNGLSFERTPASLDGAQVVDTSTLVQLLASSKSLLIDIGRGVASPKGAIWYNQGSTLQSEREFSNRIVRDYYGSHPDTLVIVMGNGVYGCDSYLAVSDLVANGYKKVAWYRGGEEAWAAEHKPFLDRRPQ